MGWLSFDGVNWLAVAIAFVVSFAFGWWYYSPAGVVPLWRRLGGITNEQMENAKMGVAFGGTILANLLGVILLAILMVQLDIDSWWSGALFGAIIGLVYRAGAHALHNGFALRHPGITALDGLHDIVTLALAGLVLGLF